mmetsp:Transcript_15234/g.34108  ORF Transcript_15234/g.34108 Transcript_15234/m.34108 type:complete len:238 (-) Transcript_15234:78-791(-)|eukprot:CAMPEP_0113302274 /NCGR_PEP_ID=MMETSP0010_2-20120614/3152_1 /TAXON_ID=216773 ORGANISM="Corethron hystrix, Strain 308" /NCGR_SAMPLE_ID=MMETSP0010_2 /ASSEMBLY_ACC=CAM_ASM_000155 /LENGTH=237 /DNA_ID=CAMNT_0000156031 /DNA_START=156 /DNA_END=869 /DNA_ORIENTATION=+ /assembly_acc=CAM_ASM_000155
MMSDADFNHDEDSDVLPVESPLESQASVQEALLIPCGSYQGLKVVNFSVEIPLDGITGDNSPPNLQTLSIKERDESLHTNGTDSDLLGKNEASGETVIGTVTIFSGTSAMVWFGLGDSPPSSPPNMGPLSVAFPRTYGSKNDRPVSQLLNGSSARDQNGAIMEEDEEDVAILTQNIALRLSGSTCMPVYVACGFPGLGTRSESNWGGGSNAKASKNVLAASLAEREIKKILLNHVET